MMISMGLRIGGGMIVLPLALRVIPEAQMGLYYTFVSIAGLITLLDFGFAPTVSRNAGYAMGGALRLVAHGVPELRPESGPNILLLSSLTGAVSAYYRLLGLVAGLCLVFGGGYFVANRLHATGLSVNLLGAWMLFAAAQTYTFSSGYWSNLLNGVGEVRRAAINAIISQICGLAVLSISLLLGLTIWSYGCSSLISAIILHFAAWSSFRKICPKIPSEEHTMAVAKDIFRALWPMAWRQGLVLLGAFFIQRGSILICSAKLGLNETAQYGLSVTLISLVCQVSGIPIYVALPSINRMRVSQDFVGIARLFLPRLYGGLGFAFIGMSALAWIGEDLLHLLRSHTTLLSPSALLLLGLVWLLEVHHSYYAMLVLTENRNPFILPALLSGVAIFLIGWWLAGILGVWGLIIAQGAVQLACNNWWPVYLGLRGIHLLPWASRK